VVIMRLLRLLRLRALDARAGRMPPSSGTQAEQPAAIAARRAVLEALAPRGLVRLHAIPGVAA
jgi:hypothetical protein